MGLQLDPPSVQFVADDASLLVDIAEVGVRMQIGSWNDGLLVRILVDGDRFGVSASKESV